MYVCLTVSQMFESLFCNVFISIEPHTDDITRSAVSKMFAVNDIFDGCQLPSEVIGVPMDSTDHFTDITHYN